MAWVVVTRDSEGRLLSRLALGPRPLTIGRDPDRDIVLASNSVSRRHARYELGANGPVFVDEGSANGSRVDGRLAVESTPVAEHNVVEIAGFRLTVEQGEASSLDEVRAGRSVASTHPAPRVGGLLRLVPVEAGAAELVPEPITVAAGEWTIGRGGDCDVRLRDGSISRRHARMVVAPDGHSAELFDLGSVNGLFINGARLDRGHARLGDRVRFGELVVCLARDTPPTLWPRLHPWAPVLTALTFAAGSLLITLLVGLNPAGGTPGAPLGTPPGDGRAALERRFSEVAEAIRLGRAALAAEDWGAATSHVEAALTLDPLNAEAARLRQDVERERKTQALVVAAERADASGDDSTGKATTRGDLAAQWRTVQQLGAVANESRYYDRARVQVARLTPALSAALLLLGQERCAKRDAAACQRALCRYFSLEGEHVDTPDAQRARELLRDAEKTLVSGGSRLRPCTAPALGR